MEGCTGNFNFLPYINCIYAYMHMHQVTWASHLPGLCLNFLVFKILTNLPRKISVKLKEIIQIKCLEQCLAGYKYSVSVNYDYHRYHYFHYYQ